MELPVPRVSPGRYLHRSFGSVTATLVIVTLPVLVTMNVYGIA